MTGSVVEVGGLPTWYAEYGTGDPLVYLHGGFSSSREFAPVREAYAARLRVFTPDRRGHGRTPDVPGPFTYELFAADTIAFLEEVVGGPARTLVMSGDDDAVIMEHTIQMYRSLPQAELAVVPGTSHVLILEKPALVTQLALDFLTTDPVPTIMPIRRA